MRSRSAFPADSYRCRDLREARSPAWIVAAARTWLVVVAAACVAATGIVPADAAALRHGDVVAPPYYQGAYALYFKTSTKDTHDDGAATSTILPAQGVNLYGYPAMTAVYADPDSNGGTTRFEEMLADTAGSGLSIFAVLSESHLMKGNYCTNYWLVQYRLSIGDPCDHSDYVDDDGNVDQPELLRDDWLASLELAAQQLSKWSKLYPHLVAFTVDDFGGHVVDALSDELGKTDERYDRAAVAAIVAAATDTAACPDCNPTFKFWPTVYMADDVGRILQDDSYYLRYDYESRAEEGDWLAVKIYIPAIAGTGPSPTARLSFLYSDGYPDGSEADMETYHRDQLFKDVVFNGHRLKHDDVWGIQGAEAFDESVASYLQTCGSPADCSRKWSNHIGNTISIGLRVRGLKDGSNALAYMTTRSLQIWDVKLAVNGHEQPYYPADVTFIEPLNEDGTCRKSDSDDICDFLTGEGNAYNIADEISGAIVVFPADTKYYNRESYEKLLQSAQSALAGGDLIAAFYADGTGANNIYPGTLAKEINAAGPYARGVVLWDPPLELAQLALTPPTGVFADVSALAAHDLTSYWPGYDNALRGWYQTFVHTGGQTGVVDIAFRDTDIGGTEGSDQSFVKVISGAGRTYYRDGVEGNECPADGTDSSVACPGAEAGLLCTRVCKAGDNTEYVSIDLGSTTTDLELSMQLTEGVWNGLSSITTGWDVSDPAAWTYSTGVSESCYASIYDAVLSAYAGVAHAPYTQDPDADGLHDCIDPEPDAVNAWYWVNERLGIDCTAVDDAKTNGHTFDYVRGNAPAPGPGAPRARVPGVLDASKAQSEILTDCEDPNSVDYGIYVQSSGT